MPSSNKKDNYADLLLDRLFNEFDPESNLPVSDLNQGEFDLREIFEQRKDRLKLSQRNVQTELGIEYRALNGILDGTQKMVDLLALQRLANFLEIPVERAVILLINKLEKYFTATIDAANKQDFISKNFDLPKLKKIGLIDNIHDFKHIEESVNKYFGLGNIYDYGKDFINIAYSSGKVKPTDNLMRNFWGEHATKILKRLDNPYEYDRMRLIEYIPSIRWHSMDEKNGLYQVIRELYKLGVTVIYEPYLTTIYVRGATLPVNGKPCIVLTDYRDNYPTFWFALIHEIHHVLFDWDEIKRRNKPHISEEIDRFDKKEVEADTFAREYLFSSEKMKVVSSQINNEGFVSRYAKAFDVHPSIIYSFYCWDNVTSDEDVFKKYKKYLITAREALTTIDPDSMLKIPLGKRMSIREKSKQLNKSVFNGL